MKRRSLIATIACVVAVAGVSQDAFARGRMYHPGLGRFMQRDPLGTAYEPPMARNLSASQFTQRDATGSNQYADGMNLYEYVRSRPASFQDPYGLSPDDRRIAEGIFQHLSSQGNKYQATLTFMTDALRIYDDLIAGKKTKVSRNQDYFPNSWLATIIVADKDFLRVKSRFETMLASRIKQTANEMRVGDTKTVNYRLPKETGWGNGAPTDDSWMDAYYWFSFSSSEDLKAAIGQAYASGGAYCTLKLIAVKATTQPTTTQQSRSQTTCRVDYTCNPGSIWIQDDYDFVVGGAGPVYTAAGLANDTMAVLQNEVHLDRFFHWQAYIDWRPSGSEPIDKK